MTTQLQERRQKMQEEKRTEFINSLRQMADILENPELRLPYMATESHIENVFARTPEQLKAWAKALGSVEKDYGHDDSPYNFSIEGKIGMLRIRVHADRELVCERIVVGSHEVEITEPDSTYEVPMITRTVIKDIVEWNCGSLLADA